MRARADVCDEGDKKKNIYIYIYVKAFIDTLLQAL